MQDEGDSFDLERKGKSEQSRRDPGRRDEVGQKEEMSHGLD